MEEFEAMMMSEEFASRRGGAGKVGGDYNDPGY